MTEKRVLVHTCCGPCFIYPNVVLQRDGYKTASLYYNPNIHPYQEFHRRLATLTEYLAAEGVPLIVGQYGLEHYFREVSFREKDRCRFCYQLRVAQTAREARERDFDFFTTTLLVSPYQDHELIRELGVNLGRHEGVAFLYRDFREGYRAGAARSREIGMYRQGYCGCFFSSQTRYEKELPGRRALASEERR